MPAKTTEFDRRYKALNPLQKKAVDAVEGPVIVVAGPGTGKTTILTLRIANIIRKTDTAPENILALTFTESGAYAMRRKLVEIIGPSAYKVNIHTFHGFAEKMIREYPDYFSRIIGSKVITDAEQIKIIERLIQSRDIELLRPYGDQNYYVRLVLGEIHLLKRENIPPKDLLESIKKDRANVRAGDENGREYSKTELERLNKRDEKNSELALIYERYEDELTRQKLYDFDDMLLELIRAMEKDQTFKLMLEENYQYILADEHQDANASQNRILELLSDFHDSPNLFIVGDEKQAIYRFQGASLENFLYFKNKYKDAIVVELEDNYRSYQEILDASHELILQNPSIPGRLHARLLSSQKGKGSVSLNEFETEDEEIEYLADRIKDLIDKGSEPGEIAVLYRVNKEAEAVSSSLSSKKIPYRIESEHNLLDDLDPAKIILLLRAINDLSDGNSLAKALLLKELGCDPASLKEIFNYSAREKIPLYRAIECLQKNDILMGLIGKDMAKDIVSNYGRFKRWSNEAQEFTLPVFLQKIIQETGMISSVVSSPDSLDRLSSLESFFDVAVKASQSKSTFYLSDFIEYLDILSTHGISTKRVYTDHIKGVRLMTAHKAKGLEFDHVFIINTADGVWGNRIKRNHFSIPILEHARDTGRIEDERRLFYVAMTRARKSVTISYSRFSGEKERVPSQFIAEIGQKISSMEKPEVSDGRNLFADKISSFSVAQEVSIFDRAFIRSKFLGQPFSVTHLNNFMECPWRYFFVNLVRIPQAESKHQMYGTAIHLALRSFFEAYKAFRDLPKKELVNLFSHYMERQPMSKDDREDSLKRGRKSLEGYYSAYKDTWNRHLFTEYGIKIGDFNLAGGESLVLTGKLDKVDLLDEKNVGVVDFKTSKPKSRNDIEGKTKSANGNYKRQLVFYQLLLNREKKFRMNYGEIDFVEPNERGLFKRERFVISEEEVSELENLLSETADSIIGLKFIGSDCKDKDCEYCRLARVLGSA